MDADERLGCEARRVSSGRSLLMARADSAGVRARCMRARARGAGRDWGLARLDGALDGRRQRSRGTGRLHSLSVMALCRHVCEVGWPILTPTCGAQRTEAGVG